jgi:drug/metabolite transporter (DMT)-like permease
MRIPRTTGWGVGLGFAAAGISGVSVYLNGLMVKSFPDPTLLAGVRNGLVGLAFVGALAVAGARGPRSSRIAERRSLGRREALGLAFLGIAGGGIAFALFFGGLALAASPASAVIQKTLFLWVALLAWPLLGERHGAWTLAALGALVAGTFLLDAPTGLGIGAGELMILAATLLWALEAIVARRLLPRIGAPTGAAARMTVGSVVLLGLVAWGGGLAGIGGWNATQWGFVALTAVLLAGYVGCWYGALERAPATVVTSVLVVGALITAALRAIAGGTLPGEPRLAGLALLALGAVAMAGVTLRARASARVPADG